MDEELLKALVDRIEECSSGMLDTCECFECPLFRTFGNGENICLKIL